MSANPPKHLYLLDILRGLASFAVIVWHYQHFFYLKPGKEPEGFDKSIQPFYSILQPVYEYGFVAVPLFFVLSGFIFYFLYYDQIKNRSVSGSEFFILRFSRLYPLHFVTLIYVAIIQMTAQSDLGAFIVYPTNDAWHFLLNIFLVSNWGMADGYSFNAPAWSISVEILLYTIFFFVALMAGKNILISVLMMYLGYWSGSHGLSDIGWGVFCFFGGGLAFLAYEKWFREIRSSLPLVLTVSIFLVGCFAVYSFPLGRMATDITGKVLLFGVCFPSIVLLLAGIQTLNHDAGRPIKIIGDITYSTYLLHFPIQLTAIWLARVYGISVDYTEAIWFVLFVGVTILLSVPTYYYFERPAQTYLRRRFKSTKSANATSPQAHPQQQN